MQALASTYSAAGEALGHTSQALVGMVGRVLAQSWSGAAAVACAAACSRDAAALASAADGRQIGGSALQRFSSQLAAAQAAYDHARALADSAVTDEHTEQRLQEQRTLAAAAASPSLLPVGLPPMLPYISPARSVARAQAEQAITDAQRAATAAAAVLNDTLGPYRPRAAPPAKHEEHHWYSPVTDFAGGAWDAVKDPVVMVGGLVGLHGDVSDNWSALGGGLAHGVTHPLDFGKALIDWQDLSQGHYARWGGQLLPSVAAAFFTGGGAAAVKGADAVGAASKTGKALNDLTDAERASALARGEAMVPGSVGNEVAARFVTPAGRLDYSVKIQEEFRNFRDITTNGTVTLDRGLWLANLHNGSRALSAGRTLKFGAPLDEVLRDTRGGFLRRLALVPQWGPRTDMSLLQIPAGTQVTMTTGTASAHVSKYTVSLAGRSVPLPTGVKFGGGPQVLLHNVDRQWVVWTGKAPWAGTSPHLLRGSAVGGATGVVTRVPSVLADITAPGTAPPVGRR